MLELMIELRGILSFRGLSDVNEARFLHQLDLKVSNVPIVPCSISHLSTYAKSVTLIGLSTLALFCHLHPKRPPFLAPIMNS